MKQFEIWATAGGTYSSKPRPSVIVQAVAFDDLESVTVVPITTTDLDADFRVALAPSEANGLQKPSFAMVDKITTIRKTGLQQKIGELSEEEAGHISQAIADFLQIKE
ncbi:MAG: type II toxin-antitoxin system PemK/MazF family toxin [Candidatus Nomurabacteria bacterium]|nr:type II toxin-antitoxin system PemK/MazF family toxin [Candidatus Nomurabacteria bacterium]